MPHRAQLHRVLPGFEIEAEYSSPSASGSAVDVSMAWMATTIDLELESHTAGFVTRMRLVV